MPLYMDFHKIPGITIDEARKAHVADEKIQKKYGVQYLQFWVNEEAGNLFCLVEGPDRATCESVHKMAHGHVACAIVELEPSYYSLIMGENIRIDQGVVHDQDGTIDLGYRSILVVSSREKLPHKPGMDGALAKARSTVTATIARFNGRIVRISGLDSQVSVFNSTQQAARCALEIQKELTWMGKAVVFRVGLGTGQPLTENNEFIEETIRLARRLSQVAAEGALVISALTRELAEESLAIAKNKKVRSLTSIEETFLTQLFSLLEGRLADEKFTIDHLCEEMGTSRPQLYRKVRSLTGMAPNDLVRHFRLEAAIIMLKRKTGNISEVAFQVGFNSPSYFAKCFAEKFGVQPSRFVTG